MLDRQRMIRPISNAEIRRAKPTLNEQGPRIADRQALYHLTGRIADLIKCFYIKRVMRLAQGWGKSMSWLRSAIAILLAFSALTVGMAGNAQQQKGADRTLAGPVDAKFPPAGEGIRKPLAAPLPTRAGWTIKGWIRIDSNSDKRRTVAALVDRSDRTLLKLGIARGMVFAGTNGRTISAPAAGRTGDWMLVSLSETTNGIVLRAGNGKPVSADIQMAGTPDAMLLAPRQAGHQPFAGEIVNFTMWQGSESNSPVANWSRPDAQLIQFENGSPTWPFQTKQFVGPYAPQNPATLPVSRAKHYVAPLVKHPHPTAPLTATASGAWKIGDWRFIDRPKTSASGQAISTPGFDDSKWLAARVPGTVLTSYVDDGVYPNPAYGLNNLLIPERLSHQDYWYRTEFVVPDSGTREQRSLDFEGINYAAQVWVNGKRLGAIKGAFIRGRFALPKGLRPGQRVAVAVRISPPPHPGLAQEESLTAGPGQNGGLMSIDGPTFAASQGWDWIPTVRDRETGIWQDVMLDATGAVRLGDPHVQTVLPKPDNSVADLTLAVPVINQSAQPMVVTVEASLAQGNLEQTVQVAPHSTRMVQFAPDRFHQLRVAHPQLWWPNGYGKPTLHRLQFIVRVNGKLSDEREIHFGIREISYELSAVNKAMELQRIRLTPDRSPGDQLIDVRHKKIRKVKGGWVVSLASGTTNSPALSSLPPSSLSPHLLIRVNGVPIAVRGGNWGMDDWLKRVSRKRMEPYFQLSRDAHINTIRNWMGQNTEQVFYDLADKYGLLVLNDFWMSSQNHNAQPDNSALFLANAADTISRFQYHPSIALWIGRNEGVPPPVINTGLDRMVRRIDGTRAYLPSSRLVEMANSGPWQYHPPVDYFTKIARGFSTEVGTPSFPTLETFKSMMPPADQWPISDTWAYHDWHQGKAGNVKPFMKAITRHFGAPTSLADFNRKAQMLDYVSHRAIFEGMNDGLFTRNSGRLLWMTQPAWPSTMWQIYSHNYDTQASYFGFKKGTEPVHVQLNLPDHTVAVVNSLPQPLDQVRVTLSNYSLSGALLGKQTTRLNAAPLATTPSGLSVAGALFDRSPVVLSKLELFDSQGRLLSRNFYWLARTASAYRAMTRMKPARISIAAQRIARGKMTTIRATVRNESAFPALMVRLSALDRSGARILPAYWSDNYVSLLPGESRTVTVETPTSDAKPAKITVDGWNVEDSAVTLGK